jgi:photosystem II stability/assembly factor-like uncharacterized protein
MKLFARFSVLAFSVLFFVGAFSNFRVDAAGGFEDWKIVGPTGGDVRAIAIDPRDKNHILITTLDAQVYSSPDAGRTWKMIANFGRPQMVLDNLIIDPRDSRRIYVSGHRHKEAGGFFKSADGGITWKESAELKNEAVHSMVQSEKDPNILLAGTVHGVWMSTNSGESFQQISSSTMPGEIDSLAIDPRGTSTFYAGTWWRAYKTTDAGKTWRLIKNGMIDDSDVFAIEIDAKNPDHVIASACSGIYESFNGGELWKKIQGIPSQSRRTRAILQNERVPGAVYAGTTEGFWLTEDGGKSWSLTTSKQLEVNSIAVHPDQPKKIYIATNNYGVMVSEDGGKNFGSMNGNFSSRFTIAVVHDLERAGRIYSITQNTATGGGYLFFSDDNGQSWRTLMKNLVYGKVAPTTILQDRANPNVLILGSNVGLFRSIDRGATWNAVSPSPRTKAVAKKSAARGKASAAKSAPTQKFVRALNERINVLARTEDGRNGIFVGTNSGLYRTYDPTGGFEKLSLGAGSNQQIYSVRTSPLDPKTIWAGTATAGLFVSHDSGATWEKTEGVSNIVPISAIEIDPTNAAKIYVGTVQTFYLSHDGGKTWIRRGGTLPVGNYNSVLINPKNPSEIFAANSLINGGGIFQSLDSGMSWRRIDDGITELPSRRFWSLMLDPTDANRMFAGTHSSGIYRIERSATAAVTDDQKRPRVAVSGN